MSPPGAAAWSTGTVFARDARDAAAVWNVTTGLYMSASPRVVALPGGGGGLLVGGTDSYLYLFATADGALLARAKAPRAAQRSMKSVASDSECASVRVFS